MSARGASTTAVALVLVIAACSSPPVGSTSPTAAAVVTTAPSVAVPPSAPSDSPAALPTPEPSATPDAASAAPWVEPPASGQPPGATPASTELQRRLPTDVGGTPYVVQGMALEVRDDVAGGDLCSIFCPGEVSAYARELGVDAGPVEVAWAVPEDPDPGSGAVIRAIRVPGAKARRLVDAWAQHGNVAADPPFPIRQAMDIGDKRVTGFWYSPLPSPLNILWAYARGDTLYLVSLVPPPDDIAPPPPLVEAVLSELP
jgi:hypothetical protein